MIETVEVAANGFRFRCDRAGDGGPLVVLLHGFPHSRHSWTGQLPALAAAGFTALAPDQRGYSPGARPDAVADYGTERLIDDVVALAAALGHDRFHLVGHDWGGQIAWLLAATRPQYLHSLTVLSRPHPAAFAQAMQADPAQSTRSRHHRAFQDPAMADRLLADDARYLRRVLAFEDIDALIAEPATAERQAAERRVMPDGHVDAYLSVLGDRAALDAALNWYRAAFQGFSVLAAEDLPNVTMPTLYLWGDRDFSVGAAAAEATAGRVDAPYTFRRIDGAGHFLSDEAGEAVTGALLAHVTRFR